MIGSLAVAFLAALSSVSAAVIAPRAAPTVCNGHAQLCSRMYSNTTFVGAHDSYAISSNPLIVSANQGVSITAQLNLGARLLQSQAHMNGGVIHLCHTSCLLFDGGSLLSYLQTIKSWLDSNPNEVLTLVVTNPDDISVAQYWGPTFVQSGIVPYAYIASSSGPGRNNWPTLGAMIQANTRLVVFMDYNSDQTAAPYILPEFNNIWEDPYDVTTSSFPCSVDRGSSPNMFMMNHFLDSVVAGVDIPNRLSASTTNSVSSILANANGCAQFNQGLYPTFVLLDFVDQGQAVAAGNLFNGVS